MLNPEELQQTAEQVDRRRESRVNQPASVTVRTEQPGRTGKFHAVLVNSSIGGLAIRHWRKELLVGQQVRVGDLIGYEGATGWASGCHLHFQVMFNDQPVNPRLYLP